MFVKILIAADPDADFVYADIDIDDAILALYPHGRTAYIHQHLLPFLEYALECYDHGPPRELTSSD